MARRPLSTTPDRRYNGENHSPTVDGDFQQHYQAAERAYGAGQYDEAHRIATMLLDQLGATPDDPEERAAVLGWRAFVALLLGHIELYGLDHPSQASRFYQTVLDSQPHDTLGELAQQGLTRASAMAEATPEPSASTPEPEATAPSTTQQPPLKSCVIPSCRINPAAASARLHRRPRPWPCPGWIKWRKARLSQQPSHPRPQSLNRNRKPLSS